MKPPGSASLRAPRDAPEPEAGREEPDVYRNKKATKKSNNTITNGLGVRK